MKRTFFEPGPGYKSGLKDLTKTFSSKSIAAVIISLCFAYTGPAILAFQACQACGFTTAQSVSWVASVYIFGGLLSFVLALKYKMPIVGAWSIPGVSMLGAAIAAGGYSFEECCGAFFIAGLIVFILGITGLIKKAMNFIPYPIVMAMIAGAFMKYGTALVTNCKADPLVIGAVLLVFLLFPLVTKKLPAVLPALIVGIILSAIRGDFAFAASDYGFTLLQFTLPKFTASTFFSLSVPLAVLVIGAENAQAIGVLKGQKYDVPINAMTIWSGIGGMLTSFFGGHNANIAGPMTAMICDPSAGDPDKRYGGAVLNGLGLILFGLLTTYAIGVVAGLPAALVTVLAGLALINILINALRDGFGTGKYRMGAFTAFIVPLSGFSLFGIGSAFWALLFGVIVSLIADSKDFKADMASSKEEVKA